MSRPFATHTKLGRLLVERGLNVRRGCEITGTYTRNMTEYLAGRKKPSAQMTTRLCEGLHVNPEDIYESEYPWTPEMQEAKIKAEGLEDEQIVTRMAVNT